MTFLTYKSIAQVQDARLEIERVKTLLELWQRKPEEGFVVDTHNQGSSSYNLLCPAFHKKGEGAKSHYLAVLDHANNQATEALLQGLLNKIKLLTAFLKEYDVDVTELNVYINKTAAELQRTLNKFPKRSLDIRNY